MYSDGYSEEITKNAQLCWVEYDYNYKTDTYSDKPTIINEPIDNYHYCSFCYEKWSNGDLF